MRSNEITMDSGVGTAAPESPVPAPRAVTATRFLSANSKIAETSSVDSGHTTTAGATASTVRHSSLP